MPVFHNYLCAGVIHHNSGKSEIGAYAFAHYLFTHAPPRTSTPAWVISKSFELVGNVAWGEKLAKYIHPRNIRWYSWLNKARGWPSAIGLKNGWVIEFKSWEQGRDAFQARSIGPVWFDEQFPQDVFIETFARTRDYNSPIWFTLTPIEPDVFLEERYYDAPAGWEWFSLDLEDNRRSRGGYVDDGWIDAFIAEIPPDFRDVRIKGKFAGFEGAVYKGFRRELHIAEPFEFNTPPERGKIACGIDFGVNNPFVCLWGYRDSDGRWTIFDEYYQPRQLIRAHADSVLKRSFLQGVTSRWADPEDAQARMELAACGAPTGIAKKDVNAGIEEVARLLMPGPDGRPRLRITSNCKHTIREISTYKWESNVSARRDAKDEPQKKDDHCMDALRYLVFSEKSSAWIAPNQIQGSSSLSSGFANIMGQGNEQENGG